MNFEVRSALTTLDARTPSFYVAEIFAHGDLTAKRAALAALKKDLTTHEATRRLLNALKLY